MKVESTDASKMAFNQTKSTREFQPDTKENKIATNTSLLQLNEFERLELPVSEKVVLNAIEKANRAISGGMRRFEFSIHERTKQIMVKVIDNETNEIVREIPPEKTLDMVAKLWEMAGIIVDERR